MPPPRFTEPDKIPFLAILIALLMILVQCAFWLGVIYVIIHFALKFW